MNITYIPTVPSYEVAIPLIGEVGQELVIAAHAEIVKLDEEGNWVQGETAWGEENELAAHAEVWAQEWES